MHLKPIERQPDVIQEMPMPANFRMAGWVYVLSNEFMPGIYKVGMTTTSPETRAKELSSATGVPFPFVIEAAFHCEDPASSERAIHEAFEDCRVSQSREFFKYDLEDLIDECRQHCEAKVGDEVQLLAIDYDVISFESLSELNLNGLFEDIGINVFGDRLAIAERLIRFGAEFIINGLNKKNISAVFFENKAYAVENAEAASVRKHEEDLREWEKQQVAAGIFGPQLPRIDDPLPF
ncbi:GIY-YIG nuclease family protein [Lonsdalea quercina]|uniref:GIY-YIG nuclease family protein n=1 Tax=Lonsdalea quercina TaxID=71657 RepID=UPI0039771E68